jgi:hypothetical protein
MARPKGIVKIEGTIGGMTFLFGLRKKQLRYVIVSSQAIN